MPEFDLLEKSEIRFDNMILKEANLNDFAGTVADVLELPRKDILVTDVLADVVTVDVLRKTINPYNLVGKKDALFAELAKIQGVTVTAQTSIHSQGMLGWINNDIEAKKDLDASVRKVESIKKIVAKRVLVFSTGTEVINNQIKDTNQQAISERLRKEGYTVKLGPVLKDDMKSIAEDVWFEAQSGGYGLIVTTGGVGAEAKDHTIEALLALDPDAATPYICTFEQGAHSRHVKKGVRIGVGNVDGVMIISLPGPNDEVRMSLEVLVKGLHENWDKNELAQEIAAVLRQKLRK